VTNKTILDSSDTAGSGNSRILQWLLALGLLYTLFFAKSLLMPMVVALLISLLLSPLVALLKRIHVPRTVSALLLLCALIVPFTVLGIELARPAQKWVKLMPELLSQVTRQVDSINAAIQIEDQLKAPPGDEPGTWLQFLKDPGRKAESNDNSSTATDAENDGEAKDENLVTERIKQGGLEVIVSLLTATPQMIAQLMIAIILILFLLIFGPGLFGAFITSFSRVRDKQRAISIVDSIRKELSHYIITVSIINAVLALCTSLTLWLLGVEDALLWGALGGLLNFAPFIGSLIMVVVLALAGLEQYGMVLFAIVPALAYLALNLIESQYVTPTVLGRHMLLNPLILILWLLIWGWLWGMIGVLLAVPLLVCIKLIAGKLELSSSWVKILETQN